jgi:hypothetical protein
MIDTSQTATLAPELEITPKERPTSLCDALDRLLNTGVVALGEAMISVAEVDLIYLRLQLVVSSVETLRQTENTTAFLPVAVPPRSPECSASSSRLAESSTAEVSPGTRSSLPAPSPSPPVADLPSRGKSVAQLVLILVKLLHELLERQAVRRMEGGGLSEEQIDRLGLALMRQVEELNRLRDEFGLHEQDLNLELGPLGKLF